MAATPARASLGRTTVAAITQHDLKPVTYGSPSFRRARFRGFDVTDIRFAAGLVLEPHTHDRTVFAVTMEGAWDSVMLGRPRDCRPGLVLTEPAGERHANHFGAAGARVLIIQADPTDDDRLRPCARLLTGIHVLPQQEVTSLARRVAAELADPDPFAALAVESAALEMFLLAARAETRTHRQPPAWVRCARDLAHDCFRTDWSLDAFAAVLAVHPAHLSRAFRREYGVTLGDYIRRLRLEWAAQRLSASSEPISRIAVEAGFADQSHFTRAFTKFARVTPGAYRRSRRAR